MTRVKRIVIQGFRGALAPLALDFTDGGAPVSVVIYGRNGTGKSSVTDAWEWLLTGRIEHLGREGAGPSSYPNFAVGNGSTKVTLELTGPIGTVSAEYDHDRISRPRTIGDLAGLRALTPHPCHIRFADLASFVFMSKTERYDKLTQFMGLSAQIEIQKGLRRVQRQIEEYWEALSTKRQEIVQRLSSKMERDCRDINDVAAALAPVAARNSLSPLTNVAALQEAAERLRAMVATDPRAQELAHLKALATALGRLGTARAVPSALEAFVASARPFKDLADELRGLALVTLLESGQAAIAQLGDSSSCPLCGHVFPGDLSGHLDQEIAKLRVLKEAHDSTARTLHSVQSALRSVALRVDAVRSATPALADVQLRSTTERIIAQADDVQSQVAALLEQLALEPQDIGAALLKDCGEAASRIRAADRALMEVVTATAAAVSTAIATLEVDVDRVRLVRDFELVHAATELLGQLDIATRDAGAAAAVVADLTIEVEDYVSCCVRDVEARFGEIAGDVSTFFPSSKSLLRALSAPH